MPVIGGATGISSLAARAGGGQKQRMACSTSCPGRASLPSECRSWLSGTATFYLPDIVNDRSPVVIRFMISAAFSGLAFMISHRL